MTASKSTATNAPCCFGTASSAFTKNRKSRNLDVSASMFPYEEQMRDFIDMMEDGVQRQTTLGRGNPLAVLSCSAC